VAYALRRSAVGKLLLPPYVRGSVPRGEEGMV
jgi:hypothetical protein